MQFIQQKRQGFNIVTFLTSDNVFLEKTLLEKTATIKRFEYSILDTELKRANWHCKKISIKY